MSDRDQNEGFDWIFDFADDGEPVMCPQCGLRWPADHLDTNSGVCISCEDENDRLDAMFEGDEQ